MINSTMMTTIPGTLLSGATEVASAKRRGTGVFVGAGFVSAGAERAIQGLERKPRWTSFNGTNAHIAATVTTAVVLAYGQGDADLPTIKQIRVPLSLRERSP